MASFNNRLRYLIPKHRRGETSFLRGAQQPYRILRKQDRRITHVPVKASIYSKWV